MTISHPARKPVVVLLNRELSFLQSQEPGVAIPEREFVRLMARLESCRPRGWEEVWLAIAGGGAGLAVAALATVLSLAKSAPAGTKELLWMLVVLGGFVWFLSLGAYLTQRRNHYERLTELKKDMEIHRTGCDS